MKSLPSYAFRAPIKFRMPTSENLVPIRLDIEVDGQRFKDAFTWNPTDPDSEVSIFAKRTVKDLKLPPTFISPITQSIQTQLSEFCSFQGQDMHAREKILPIKLDLCVNSTVVRDQFLWDLGNFDSDPEDFAKTFCDDMNITDPQVGPAIAVSIREQLYEMAIQNVAFAREYRIGKKSRRGFDPFVNSKASNNALDLAKIFGSKGSAIRKQKERDLYDPIVDILSNEEVFALDARERNSRPI